MTAFYEWKKAKPRKIPYRIFLKGKEIFFVAGIYFRDKEGNKNISIVTTEPNEFIRKTHHRMPIIFSLNDAIEYLTSDNEKSFDKCKPLNDATEMQMEVANI